eukprot:4285006-Pyramimonas_sp.AAC.2
MRSSTGTTKFVRKSPSSPRGTGPPQEERLREEKEREAGKDRKEEDKKCPAKVPWDVHVGVIPEPPTPSPAPNNMSAQEKMRRKEKQK